MRSPPRGAASGFMTSGEMSEVTKKREKLQVVKPDAAPRGGLLILGHSVRLSSVREL